MNENNIPGTGQVFDFATFVTELRGGETNHSLGERLKKVCAAVVETGKVGTLSLKLTVKRESGRAVVSVDMPYKAPEHRPLDTLFYFGEDGGLYRDDPRQLTLKQLTDPPIRMVPRGGDE